MVPACDPEARPRNVPAMSPGWVSAFYCNCVCVVCVTRITCVMCNNVCVCHVYHVCHMCICECVYVCATSPDSCLYIYVVTHVVTHRRSLGTVTAGRAGRGTGKSGIGTSALRCDSRRTIGRQRGGGGSWIWPLLRDRCGSRWSTSMSSRSTKYTTFASLYNQNLVV